jgi:LPS-assembly lipoprotein
MSRSSIEYQRAGARRLALALALVSLLGGCGFHLRGAVDVPDAYQPLYIAGGGPLVEAVRDRLVGSDVRQTYDPTKAGLILTIYQQKRDSRVVAVDQRGKALAYEQRYRFDVEAAGGDGTVLMPRQTLLLERTFDYNPDVAVLGEEIESEYIYQDMVDDAAGQVLLRLRVALERG